MAETHRTSFEVNFKQKLSEDSSHNDSAFNHLITDLNRLTPTIWYVPVLDLFKEPKSCKATKQIQN